MKKAVCISCTQHYHERTKYILNCLREQGYECIYLTSDFSHSKKERFTVDVPGSIQIPTRAYKKNISIARILSHMKFAKDAIRLAAEIQPDLLYVEIPPNSLCTEAAKYKRKNPNVKLIFDVFDMWPESFPNNRAKQLLELPFQVWGNLRNKWLPKGDLVLTECDLFREKLQRYLANTKSKTLYLCRPDATVAQDIVVPTSETLNLCYLGSINNIIDIPTITDLIGRIHALRPTVLHIIGDGESRDAFISSVSATGAEVVFHGKIYDDAEKQRIFDMCSFGLNIMKDSVFIGLTMKSIDYFAGALPVINSIPGDTWRLIQERSMGINLCRSDLQQTALQVAQARPEQLMQMRSRTLQSFRELFSQQIFEGTFTELL